MFYDRLLLITSLKSRLLSSSSFSQLYTSEKLPLRKFRREGLSLTPLIAGLLAACGGGTTYVPIGDTPPGGTGGTGTGTGTGTAGDRKITVIDGSVEGARVFIDRNGDGDYDEGTDTNIGFTDATGSVVILDADRKDADGNYIDIEITVDLAGATDLSTGETFEAGRTYTGSLPEGADETVISPISTIIVGLVDGDTTGETTVEDVLEMIFGEDSGITIEDVTDPRSFEVGDGSASLGSLAGKANEIGRASIELEILLGKHTDFADIETALGEVDFGLTPAERAEADARIEKAQERADGKPFALPKIARGDNNAFAVDENGERAVDENNEEVNVGVNANENYDEDTEIEIDVEDWGFRDPGGNTDEAITELVSITISDITRTATDENGNIITDEKGDPSSIFTGVAAGVLKLVGGADAGPTITLAQLDGLYFVPAENQYGVIKITYTVNDGEADSDEAVLTFTIDSVNDEPSDILLTGDRSATDDGDRATRPDPDTRTESTTSTDGGLYVLVDGVIKAFNASNEIVDAGIVSHSDVEDNVGTYSLSGEHGALFEIDANDRLKLIDPDTKLADGGIYEVKITYNDGGVNGEYSETYYIVQGGLYIQPAGTTDAQNRVYSQSSEYNTDVTEGPTTIGLVAEKHDTLLSDVFGADDSTGLLLSGGAAAVAATRSFGTAPNTITFTADDVGTNGNLLRIAYVTGADGTGVDLNYDAPTNTLTITYEAASTIKDLFAAFASSDAGAQAAAAVFDLAGPKMPIGTFGDDDEDGYTYEYKFTGTNNDNALFTLDESSGLLTFIGGYSGDYESKEDLTIEFTRAKATFTGFEGQKDVDASGDLGDADLRTFSYSDGDITIVDVDGDDEADAAAASVTLGTTNTVTFTADAKGTAGNSLIIAYDDSGAAESDVVLTFSGSTLTITYEADTHTIADLVTAFASASTDITSRFDLTVAGATGTTLTTVFIRADGSSTGSSELEDGVNNAPTENAVQASVTVADTSSVSILKFTAFEPGAAGNSFGIKIVEDSTIASTATSITFDDATGKFTITIGTSDTPTVTQAIAAIETAIEASPFTIDGVTGNFSTFITMENVAPDSVLGNSVNLNGTDVSLTGGLDDVEHRTIDVAAGTIYLPDGTEISFDAVTGLRITEESADSYVIVDDVEGDGTYEVRAVATLPDGDDYYVLGTVEPLAVPVRDAVQAKLVRATADGTAGATFTADTAGLAGNSESVTFVTGADGSSIVLAYASNVLTITHAADSTLGST